MPKRRKLTLLIIGILVLIGGGFGFWQYNGGKLFSSAATTSGQTFSDVPQSYWAYLEIEAAYRGGIVQGYSNGTFKPEGVVTHDQIAVFLARAIAGGDSKVPSYNKHWVQTFSDIPRTYWAYKYIEYLVTKEVLICLPPGNCSYKPTINVTRELMAVYLARAIAGGERKVPPALNEPTFQDVPKTNPAYKYIEYLAKMGVVSGYPDPNGNTYRPTDVVTRAQLSVYVTRAFGLISSALVADISGKVTTSTGAVLANAYLVFDEGEGIVQADANGNFNIKGLDATTYEVEIYDANGRLYENPDLNKHLISPVYGANTINFSGLVGK